MKESTDPFFNAVPDTAAPGPATEVPEPEAAGTVAPENEEIDLARIQALAKLNLPSGITPASPDAAAAGPGSTAGLLDELADDVLHLLQRMQAMEQRLEAGWAKLDQIERQRMDFDRFLVQRLDSLQHEVAGERKSLAAVSVFNAVLPTLDAMQVMARGMSASADSPVRRQVEAVLDALTRVFRNLGFAEFRPEPGQPFQPGRMECLGYGQGPPDVVLDVTRPGYMTQNIVVRPAGVILADPREAAKSKEKQL